MAVTIRIPTPLRPLTGGEEQVSVEGATIREALDDLERKHPGMKDRLLDDKGVRRFVNLYVGEEDIRFLDGLGTALKAGDEISVVPAIAGGGAVRAHATGEDAARSASPAAAFLRSAARVPSYTPLRSSGDRRRTGGPAGLLEPAFAAGNPRGERMRGAELARGREV